MQQQHCSSHRDSTHLAETLLGALLLVPLLVMLPGVAAAGAPADSVIYVASGDAACRTVGYEELACGDFGSFLIGSEAPPVKSRCAAAPAASFEIGRYPVHSLAVEEESWFPCAGGSCFNAEPSGDWVAVVDWDAPHGWSVGETIRQSSEGRVETKLYALESSGIAAIDELASAGDLHVLAQLCRIAEDARSHPPLALNLSFGRLAEASCDGEASGTRITCQITALIAHLRQRWGVATFAAAGNNGRLLFPAAAAEAMAVGAIDLRHLARGGEARPIPQTPLGAAGLFPGSGLFLATPQGGEPWPAPPGSSYASAFAAGWYAGFRARYPRLAERELAACGEDFLAPTVTPAGFRLACGTRSWPGSRLTKAAGLMEIALGRHPEVLAEVVPRAIRALEVEERNSSLPERSFDEMQRHFNHPAPEGEPCVPCIGGGSGGPGGGGAEGQEPSSGGSLDEAWGIPRLDIDLSHSQGVPAGLELVGLYLQVGREVYRFSDSENTTLLGELALGVVHRLEIANLPNGWRFRPAALVWALRLEEQEGSFYSSTPVLIHD